MISTAQAKLNLTLEVLKKRPDGYHEIKSVVQTISFLDKINIQPANSIEVNCSMTDWSYKDSLVAKAVNLMKSLPRAAGKGARIQIEKKIPLSSGLGGDSSDAAAVMRGLNLVWDMGLSLKDLISMGVKLGTDIPLFFYGGTLLLEGRGEIIRPLKPMPHMTVILLFPDIPRPENKTMHLYSQITVRDYTDGRNTLNFMNTIEGRSSGQSRMFNVFDETAVKYFIFKEQSVGCSYTSDISTKPKPFDLYPPRVFIAVKRSSIKVFIKSSVSPIFIFPLLSFSHLSPRVIFSPTSRGPPSFQPNTVSSVKTVSLPSKTLPSGTNSYGRFVPVTTVCVALSILDE